MLTLVDLTSGGEGIRYDMIQRVRLRGGHRRVQRVQSVQLVWIYGAKVSR